MITCTRCRRFVSKGNVANENMLWAQECFKVEEGKNARNILHARQYMEGEGMEIARAFVDEQKKTHGCERVMWSGEASAPVNCTTCNKAWHSSVMRRKIRCF